MSDPPPHVTGQLCPSFTTGAASLMQVAPGAHVEPQATDGAQVPFTQELDAQSRASPQACPSGQPGEQAGAEQTPFAHTPDAQSFPDPHPAPSGQLGLHAGATH